MPGGAGNAVNTPVVPNMNTELSPDRSEEDFSPDRSVFGDLLGQAHDWEVRDQSILVPNTQEPAGGDPVPLHNVETSAPAGPEAVPLPGPASPPTQKGGGGKGASGSIGKAAAEAEYAAHVEANAEAEVKRTATANEENNDYNQRLLEHKQTPQVIPAVSGQPLGTPYGKGGSQAESRAPSIDPATGGPLATNMAHTYAFGAAMSHGVRRQTPLVSPLAVASGKFYPIRWAEVQMMNPHPEHVDDETVFNRLRWFKNEFNQTYEGFGPQQTAGAEHVTPIRRLPFVRKANLQWTEVRPLTLEATDGPLVSELERSNPTRERPPMMDVDTQIAGKRDATGNVEERPLKRSPVSSPRGPIGTASVSYQQPSQAPAQGPMVGTPATFAPMVPGGSLTPNVQPVPEGIPARESQLEQQLLDKDREIDRLRTEAQQALIQQQEGYRQEATALTVGWKAAAEQYKQQTTDDLQLAEANAKRSEEQRIAQIQRKAEADRRSDARIQEQQVDQAVEQLQHQASQEIAQTKRTAEAAIQEKDATIANADAHIQQMQQAGQSLEAQVAYLLAEKQKKDNDVTMLFRKVDQAAAVQKQQQQVIQEKTQQAEADRKALQEMQDTNATIIEQTEMQRQKVIAEAEQKVLTATYDAQTAQARVLQLEKHTALLTGRVAKAESRNPAPRFAATVEAHALSPRASVNGTSGSEPATSESEPPSESEKSSQECPTTQEWVSPERHELINKPDAAAGGNWLWFNDGDVKQEGKPEMQWCIICQRPHLNVSSAYCGPGCQNNHKQGLESAKYLQSSGKPIRGDLPAPAAKHADVPASSTEVPSQPAPPNPSVGDEHMDTPENSLAALVKMLADAIKKPEGDSKDHGGSTVYKAHLPEKLGIKNGPGTRNKENWKNNTWRIVAEASGRQRQCIEWLDEVSTASSLDELESPGPIFGPLDLLLKNDMKQFLTQDQRDEIETLEKESRREKGYFINGRQLVWIILRDKTRDQDETDQESRQILLNHTMEDAGGNSSKFQHIWKLKRMDVNAKDLSETSYINLLKGRYEDQVKHVQEFQWDYALMKRESFKSKEPITLEMLVEAFDNMLAFKKHEKIIAEGRARDSGGAGNAKGKAMGMAAPGNGPKGDCYGWMSKGCALGDRCPYRHDEEKKGRKVRPRSQSRERGTPSRKGKGKGRLVKPVLKGKGKGKGKDGRGYWLGFPTSAKGLGRAPNLEVRKGKAPNGTENATPCKAHYTPEGCPFGKNGKPKCRYWHPPFCRYFQKGTCPLPGGCPLTKSGACTWPHKMKPKTEGTPGGDGKDQGYVALTDEQKAQKKAEKKQKQKEAKAAKKETAKANGTQAPAAPKTPKAKAKGKAGKPGAQGRAAIATSEEDYVSGDYWESDGYIYAFVEADQQYDQDEWYYDPETDEWWCDYIDYDEPQNPQDGGSYGSWPWGQ